MKLAKIEHYRCSQRETNTYVWVPDGMSRDVFTALIESARQDCLTAEKKVEGLESPPRKSWWDFMAQADQHKTLAQVRDEYAEHERVYKEWDVKRDAARKSFAKRLIDLSGGTVQFFFDGEFGLEADCEWGHNHGVKVDYGATDI